MLPRFFARPRPGWRPAKMAMTPDPVLFAAFAVFAIFATIAAA
jgi:hypothetical protein